MKPHSYAVLVFGLAFYKVLNMVGLAMSKVCLMLTNKIEVSKK